MDEGLDARVNIYGIENQATDQVSSRVPTGEEAQVHTPDRELDLLPADNSPPAVGEYAGEYEKKLQIGGELGAIGKIQQ